MTPLRDWVLLEAGIALHPPVCPQAGDRVRPSPCVGINPLSPPGRSTFSHDGGPQPASPRLVHSKCEHRWLMREVPPSGRFLGLGHTACPETKQWLYRESSTRVFGDYGDRGLAGSECSEQTDCNELQVWSQEHAGWRLSPVLVQYSPACPAYPA